MASCPTHCKQPGRQSLIFCPGRRKFFAEETRLSTWEHMPDGFRWFLRESLVPQVASSRLSLLPLASLIRYHCRVNCVSCIAVEEFAVTDGRGTAEFFIHNQGISSINSLFEASVAREAPRESRIDKIRVRTRSLDDYCESIKWIPDLIKIDVEGAELMVIRGPQRSFRNTNRR